MSRPSLSLDKLGMTTIFELQLALGMTGAGAQTNQTTARSIGALNGLTA